MTSDCSLYSISNACSSGQLWKYIKNFFYSEIITPINILTLFQVNGTLPSMEKSQGRRWGSRVGQSSSQLSCWQNVSDGGETHKQRSHPVRAHHRAPPASVSTTASLPSVLFCCLLWDNPLWDSPGSLREEFCADTAPGNMPNPVPWDHPCAPQVPHV